MKSLAILAREIGLDGASDEELANKFIKSIREYNEYMKIPKYLEPYKDEDLETMVDRALAEGNPLYPVPKLMGRDEMRTMYKIVTNKK